jgi:homogentisate 1,2-dioxygenase
MLDRRVAGEVPRKHHIALRDAEGQLRYEECITRRGFDGPYTILYHQHRPQAQVPAETGHGFSLPTPAEAGPLRKRHYRSQDVQQRGGAPIDARTPLLFNRDVVVSVLFPSEPDPVYFLNGDGDDLYFIHKGSGVVRSILGDVRFEEKDYVCIPKGIMHRIIPDEGVEQHWLSLECMGGLRLLDKWRNETGQLRMDAPYSHRDFRRPEFVGPRDEGIRQVVVKRSTEATGQAFHAFSYDFAPMDAVGWDGTVYPWVFPILNFQPRAGLVHLPPDWHGTFATRGALICSFVPRVVDFHPESIPCPYPHASVDCDEILFYVEGNFISRKGIGPGSVSHHPAGIAHGPHPGAYENSIGMERTEELAVMMDTEAPLVPTAQAAPLEDTDYHQSFVG